MGFDPPADTAAWVEREGFPYEVWTDDDRTLALTYGAASSASANYPARITVLLDADGALLLEYTDNLSLGEHPSDVLADCAILFGD